MPDWSRARDVKPDRETHVRLYDQGASDPIKSRLLSATENSLTLQREEGQARTLQRKSIRKILRYREWGQRCRTVAFGIAVAVGGNAFGAEADFAPGAQVLFGVAIPVGIAFSFAQHPLARSLPSNQSLAGRPEISPVTKNAW